MTIYHCKYCKKEIKRASAKIGIFCDNQCKGEWQKTQKPVNKEWLIQKYIIEELSTYDIAKIVKRNPKQVWHWLKGYGIKTRTTSEEIKKNSYSIKMQNGEVPHPMKGKKHSEQTKSKMSASKSNIPNLKIRGNKNGMYGRRGAKSPQWKGGTTPERQKLYASEEWKELVQIVLCRDKYKCVRCGCHSKYKRKHNKESTIFCLHHVKSFSLHPSERDKLNNIILVCENCHHWIHSKQNINKEYLNE